MTLYLVCYDVEDDAIRERIARCLCEYGDRVQKSVFEVTLRDDAMLARLREELVGILGEERNLRMYRLCADCHRASRRIDDAPIEPPPGTVIC